MPAPERQTKRRLLLFIGVAIAYAAGSRMAFTWFGADGVSASFFPSAGVTLAALVLTRRRDWPIVLAAAGLAELVLDLYHGLDLVPTLGYVVSNLTEPLVGALLLTTAVARVDLSRTRHLAAFVLCAVMAGPAVGATLGATTRVLLDDGDEWLSYAAQWWVGDGLGVLVVAGTVLALRSASQRPASVPRFLEGLGLGAAALLATVLVFWFDWLPLVYVPVALLIVIAFRLGTAGVAVTGAGVAFLAAEATAEGHNFWDNLEVPASTGIVYLQLGLGVLIVSCLALAAEIAERERAAGAWASADAARRESATVAAHAERLRALAESVGQATTRDEVARALESHGFGGVVGLPPPSPTLDGPERYVRESSGRIARDAYARVALLEGERRARQRAELLERHAAGLSAATTLAEVALSTVSLVEQAGVEIAGVERLREGTVEVLAVTGVARAALERFSDYALESHTPGAAAIREGAIVEVRTVADYDARFPESADLRAAQGVEAVLAVPLRDGSGRITGAVSAAFTDARQLTPELRQLLVAMAEQTGVALERATAFVAEREARERAEDLERRISRVQEVTAALAATRSAKELADAVVTQLIPAVGGMGGSVFVLEEDGALHLVGSDSYPQDVLDRYAVINLGQPIPPADALRTGAPLLYGTLDELHAAYPDLEREVQLGEEHGAAFAHVPLAAGDRPVGMLIVAYSEPRAFDAFERAHLFSATEAAGQALARVLLDEAEREARWRAEMLERHARHLAASASVQAVVDATVGVLSELDATTLWLLDDATMILAGTSGFSEELRDAYGRVPVADRTLVGEAVRTARPVEVETGAEYDERFPDGTPARIRNRSESVRSVPLLTSSGRVRGALTVSARTPKWFTTSMRQLLDGIAEQTSLALERAELHEQAERSAADAALLVHLGDVLERAATAAARAQSLVDLLERELGIPAAVRLLDEEDGDPRLLAESRSWERTEDERWEAVALRARGRTLGMLELRSDGAFARSGLGREIVARVALALDNALLYDRERKVSHTLQLGLLGGALTGAEGVELAAAYRAGTAALDVGGDWYDAFELPDGSLALVVGDVVGHGLDAAIVMGQLRGAVRALAPAFDPAGVLEHLDTFVEGIPDAGMATIAYVELDPRSGAVRYACAGHPPPLVVPADGEPHFLWEGRSAAIASLLGVERGFATAALGAGDTLVLYTDGVVERRSESLDVGLARLARVAGERGPVAALVEHIPDELLEGQVQDDDVCVLVARRLGLRPPFVHRFPAEPSELAPLRARLREWLEEDGLAREVVDEMLLGVSEAAANSIEHGHAFDPAGTVTVEVTVPEEGRLHVTVSDDGRWRDGHSDPDRGRGLHLIEATMDSLSVDSGPSGTVVRMERAVKGFSRV